VLRPDGHFLYADFRGKGMIDTLRRQVHRSGMRLVRETNITHSVVEALKLDHDRRMTLIRESRHKVLSKLLQQFAGVKGSKVFEGFRTGALHYLSFVLQKH
jgi:hypothetical protein